MHRVVAEVAADDVDAERQRQARLEQPPLAEVEALLQAFVPVGQLPFVDDQAGARTAGSDLVEDLVERQHAVRELAAEREPQDEVGGRQLPGTTISVSRSSSSESFSCATTIGP